MTIALVEESLQLVAYAHRADGDALRTPSESPVGRHDFARLQNRIQIVHRLSLPHKHDVGQQVYLRQCYDLVQNVGSRQVSVPSLLARLTEQAVHLTAHLTRDAQRSPVFIRDIHRFHKQSFSVLCF